MLFKRKTPFHHPFPENLSLQNTKGEVARVDCEEDPQKRSATSVISSCILRIAANPVFRRVHLRAYTLAAALAITFLATLVSVALKTLLSLRRRSLAKCLAWSAAFPVAVALPPISAKQGAFKTTFWRTPWEH